MGVSPIAELGLKVNGANDEEELRYMLEKILEYPCSDMADIHRDSNRMGTMDLEEETESVVTSVKFENVRNICNCLGQCLHLL